MNPVFIDAEATVSAPAVEPATPDIIDELPLPYLELDASGVITRANRATLALRPSDHGELVGKSAWEFIATDEKDPSFAAYCSTLHTGEKPLVVHRSLYDRSGEFRTYEMYRSLMRDSEGKPVGMRMLCVDVTEAKKALEEAHRSRLQLESVMESIGEAVIVTDAVGFIRSVNPAAETLLGWEAAELRGRLIEEGVQMVAYLAGDRSELDFTLSLERPSKGLATLLDRGGNEVHAEVGTSPIFDKENRSTTGVVLVLRKLEFGG